jgi:hypothetical protein
VCVGIFGCPHGLANWCLNPFHQEKLDALGTRSSQEQILSLLRQLKFVENVMFQDRDVYLDPSANRDPELPTTEEVEMIVLDLL